MDINKNYVTAGTGFESQAVGKNEDDVQYARLEEAEIAVEE